MRIHLLIVAGLKITLFTCGCENDITSLEIDPDRVELIGTDEATTLTLTAFDKDENPIPTPDATWSSSDPRIAEVDERGTLRAKGTGQAIVTAFFGGVEQEVSVDVLICDELRVEKSELYLNVGESSSIEVQGYDENRNPVVCPLNWMIKDLKVIELNELGDIVGVAPGKTFVTVNSGKSIAVFNVEVSPPPLTTPPASKELSVGSE